MFSVTNIYLAAILHGLFQIAVLVFNRKGNQVSNRLLAALIGLLDLALWNVYADFAGWPAYAKPIDFNNWISPFFWGPVLYLYVGSVTGLIRINPQTMLKHLSFGIALFLFDMGLMAVNSERFAPQFHSTLNTVRLLALYVQLALYLFASLQLLRKYNDEIKKNFSSIQTINLSWLKILVAIFAIILCIDMSLFVPAILRQEPVPFFTLIILAESFAVFAIGYFSMVHTGVLFSASAEPDAPKYLGSPIDSKMSEKLMAKLTKIMDQSEPYMKNDLSLAELAKLVDVSPYYLSQVINEQSQKNFYDYVNEYRARRAAEILEADHKANITKVAYDSGFNNRVSFNNAFKKHIGMTPSQYRNQNGEIHLGAAE